MAWGHPPTAYAVATLTWVVGGRRLPLGVGIAPALRRVLVRRGATGTAGEERESGALLRSVGMEALATPRAGLTQDGDPQTQHSASCAEGRG